MHFIYTRRNVFSFPLFCRWDFTVTQVFVVSCWAASGIFGLFSFKGENEDILKCFARNPPRAAATQPPIRPADILLCVEKSLGRWDGGGEIYYRINVAPPTAPLPLFPRVQSVHWTRSPPICSYSSPHRLHTLSLASVNWKLINTSLLWGVLSLSLFFFFSEMGIRQNEKCHTLT